MNWLLLTISGQLPSLGQSAGIGDLDILTRAAAKQGVVRVGGLVRDVHCCRMDCDQFRR